MATSLSNKNSIGSGLKSKVGDVLPFLMVFVCLSFRSELCSYTVFRAGLNVISGVNDFLIYDKKSLHVGSCPRYPRDLIKDIAVLGVNIFGIIRDLIFVRF